MKPKCGASQSVSKPSVSSWCYRRNVCADGAGEQRKSKDSAGDGVTRVFPGENWWFHHKTPTLGATGYLKWIIYINWTDLVRTSSGKTSDLCTSGLTSPTTTFCWYLTSCLAWSALCWTAMLSPRHPAKIEAGQRFGGVETQHQLNR